MMAGQSDVQQIQIELSQLRQELAQLRAQIAGQEPPARARIHTDHPHIVRIEGVRGGRPIIRGAGVSVQTIVEESRLGLAPEQIVEDYEGVLTLAEVYDALSYYHDHPSEIEQYIAENRASLWKGPQINRLP